MTRRAWLMLVVGAAVVAAALAAVAVADRGDSITIGTSSPSGGAFTDTQWNALKQQLAQDGFRAGSVHVVGAADPGFVLLAATRVSGSTCFMPVQGMAVRATVCHLTKPLTTFSVRTPVTPIDSNGHSVRVPSTGVVGILRPDVASVSARWTTGRGPESVQYLEPVIAAGARVFGCVFFGNSVVLVAHSRGGKVVARLTLPTRGS
jgi:hypothetical protein